MRHYRNPLTSFEVKQPYVLKWAGTYWAFASDTAGVALLLSRDLVVWNPLGHVLAGARLQAPHVTYDNSMFYLYHVLDGQLRVAAADTPDGPYRDSGLVLAHEAGAAHVFTDDDGTRYLFYSTPSGIVLDRLLDPLRLAGEPRPVTHGGTARLTLRHQGRYHQIFVNGGLRCATTRDLFEEEAWELQPDLIATHVEGVSVVLGPDLRQRWALHEKAGVLALDAADFVGSRFHLLGPTGDAQPPPTVPPAPRWSAVGGTWRSDGDEADQTNSAHAVAELRDGARSSAWTAEVTLRASHALGADQAVGVSLLGPSAPLIELRLTGRELLIADLEGGWGEVRTSLPPGFRADVWHVLRLDAYDERVRLTLDGRWHWQGRWDYELLGLALCTWKAAAEFRGYARVAGWEDRFDAVEGSPGKLGWEGDDGWRIRDGQLLAPSCGAPSTLRKGPPLTAYELVVNMQGGAGFWPALSDDDGDVCFMVDGGEWSLGEQRGPLPASYDATAVQQFRVRRLGGRLQIRLETQLLCEAATSTEPAEIGLYCHGAPASFDMVRVTALEEAEDG